MKKLFCATLLTLLASSAWAYHQPAENPAHKLTALRVYILPRMEGGAFADGYYRRSWVRLPEGFTLQDRVQEAFVPVFEGFEDYSLTPTPTE